MFLAKDEEAIQSPDSAVHSGQVDIGNTSSSDVATVSLYPSLPTYSQKLKKAKQHVAAQKVPKPKAGKVLFKTSSLATTSSSTSIFAKSPHKKPAGTKKKKEKGEGVILQPPAPSPSSLVGSLLATGQGVAGSPGVKSEMGGEQGVKKTGEGSEPPKPPPVLPEDLPEDISTTIQLFQEVLYIHTMYNMCTILMYVHT